MNKERLINCFSEALKIKKTTVTEELKYQSISSWDSVGHMALIAAIETEF